MDIWKSLFGNRCQNMKLVNINSGLFLIIYKYRWIPQKTSPMCQVDVVCPQEFSDSKTPRYLFQGPTANFIAVLVETGGGIDLKTITTCAEKSWFFQRLARRSNGVSLVLLLFECPICIWHDHRSVDSIDMGENLCTHWAKQSSPNCNKTSKLFFVSSNISVCSVTRCCFVCLGSKWNKSIHFMFGFVNLSLSAVQTHAVVYLHSCLSVQESIWWSPKRRY